MKKKILFVAIALMMFMGVISASSINGDYKGNPILKVISNGEAIEPGSVPAMMYDDNIMIPSSILKSVGIGINLSINADSVEISFPNESKGISINALMKAAGLNGTNHLLNYVEHVINGDESTQLNLYPTFNFWDNGNSDNFHKLLILAGGVDVQKIRVEDQSNTISFINSADVISFYRGELNSGDFASRIKFIEKVSPTSVTPVAPLPDRIVTSNVIESKIDDDFNGFDGETIFKLANGQIWQQDDYQYNYHYSYRPDVTIYKDGSTYKMIVEGVDKKVKVKRLK